MRKALIVLTCLLFPVLAMAQVPVVDVGPDFFSVLERFTSHNISRWSNPKAPLGDRTFPKPRERVHGAPAWGQDNFLY